MLLGACAGSIAALVCYPFDVVRRALQIKALSNTVSSENLSMIFKNIIK